MKRWPTKSLGEMCDVRIGRTPRRDEPRFWGGDAVWVTIRELNGGIITSSKETVSTAAVQECMPEPIPCGTLLFSFKLSIGKMAVAGCPLYTNEAIAALPIRNPAELSRDFLRYALLRKSHESTANTAVMGKVLNKAKVQQLQIPLPPLMEQERIVKLLDEADELRKLRAQADRRSAALIPALFHEMFGDPVQNQKKWLVQPFSNVVINHDSHRKPVKEADRAKRHGQYPYYGASGIIDFIDDHLVEGTFMLIAEDGMNLVTRTKPIAFIATGKFWVNNHAHIVAAKESIDLAYLREFLNIIDVRDFVTGIDQMKLTRSNMDRIPVPVPPLPLQKEFAQRVTEIRELETSQATSRTRLDALFQSMLHRAFNGNL